MERNPSAEPPAPGNFAELFRRFLRKATLSGRRLPICGDPVVPLKHRERFQQTRQVLSWFEVTHEKKKRGFDSVLVFQAILCLLRVHGLKDFTGPRVGHRNALRIESIDLDKVSLTRFGDGQDVIRAAARPGNENLHLGQNATPEELREPLIGQIVNRQDSPATQEGGQ